MTITIAVNNLSLVHRCSGGVSRATLADVCKTPPAMVPVPYPNVTFSRDLADGTTSVHADGGRMIAVKGSIFTPSTGDEPGVGGGVLSGVHKKESRWLTYSMDVKIEGRNACRLTDKKLHNRGNTIDAAGEYQEPLDKSSGCDWEKKDGALVGAGSPPCGCKPSESKKLADVAPVTPGCENAENLRQVVFVNGIMNDAEDHCDSLKEIAKKRCVAVTGVYNESRNFVRDLTQCIGDKLGIGKNPANDTLAGLLRDQLASGQPLEIMAHSQGALITSRAIGDVANNAAIRSFGAPGVGGPDWSRITVSTYGGAAWTYPPGPTYNHTVNVYDPVPLLFGRGRFLPGALAGGLLGGPVGALLGGSLTLFSPQKDLTRIAERGLHSFLGVYLEDAACLCKDEGAP